MIRKIIRALVGRATTRSDKASPPAQSPSKAAARPRRAPSVDGPAQYKGKALGIDPQLISSAAFSVAQTLQKRGYAGLLVGGAVRDLMLGMRPKDFDVATDATPEEVKRLFRRAFIIGRRFRIVHVMIASETIEVTTFRAAPTQKRGHVGRVLDDNDFGSQAEDAARRDFTVNALYYDPVAEVVHDYFDAVGDLRARVLRMIGDPLTRYREDPVRILRALRFAAKLDFTLDKATEAPIRGAVNLLKDIPEARLFMEFMKSVMSGRALACLQALHHYGLDRVLWRELGEIVATPSPFVRAVLSATDQRIHKEQSVSPGFLLAGLCWDEFYRRWQALIQGGEFPAPALHQAADEVFAQKLGQFGIQRKIESDIREIWDLQARFLRNSGKMPYRLVAHPRFRAGYDFLLLRAQSGDPDAALAQWWTDFYEGDEATRAALLVPTKKVGSLASRSSARRRRKKSSAPNATPTATE